MEEEKFMVIKIAVPGKFRLKMVPLTVSDAFTHVPFRAMVSELFFL